MKTGFSIPEAPPRPYPWTQAYRGRVWRDLGATVTRDFILIAVAVAFVGVANGHSWLMWGGLVTAATFLVLGQGLLALGNWGRIQLIRAAPAAQGTVGKARRVWLITEIFRSAKERTYALSYRFETATGQSVNGRVWICGCVRDRLPAGTQTPIIYDAERPHRSLPMRLAVMVAPHR